MTTSIIPSLENFYDVTQQNQNHYSRACTLLWRRGKLLVKPPGRVKLPYLPSLNNQRSLVECLKHSPINLVSIDAKLGEDLLQFWADACEQAHKPIFLRVSPSNKQLKQSNQTLRWLQRIIDWIVAFSLLLFLSPVILGLIVLLQFYSPESLFCHEWRVGEKGKLFRAVKFSTTPNHNITLLGRWMHRYSLNNLPLLFNVLRGDMSLMGSRSSTLADAIQLVEEKFRIQNTEFRNLSVR
ncbi:MULTISPECIES: heterocyst development glycosyltransferase HepC [Nostoc]|uniref:Sugar transferase n=1 Tax=Nostoc paludosum FACHB-159 TaxID=2692908 RepID=A0ABR8K398_9NOSO|nr:MULTISPECIES: heterocyst development glycosyltransferase HepC [Nostoc]MBD2676234.1 sugar transferase [Nostoc sp. FACHB-857]MBD2732637.1 sugar transferase [Nostoc paludosum FACHB-159]